ncbi:hypothetical protein F4774DRAFT_405926 [Daldinia eschscholtzii]|nr:hypothetical protein F4774DRAFT_405926 [Daldinia eschscholtzii]
MTSIGSTTITTSLPIVTREFGGAVRRLNHFTARLQISSVAVLLSSVAIVLLTLGGGLTGGARDVSILDITGDFESWKLDRLPGGRVRRGSLDFHSYLTLPSTLTAPSESYIAVARGMYSFVCSLDFAWGATMAAIVVNDRVNVYLDTVENPTVRSVLASGGTYTHVYSFRFTRLG